MPSRLLDLNSTARHADTSAGYVDTSGSILHVIVGGRPPVPGRTRYRRDRFAEFLAAQPTTAAVVVLDRLSVQTAPAHVQWVRERPIRYFGLRDFRKTLAYGGPLQRRLFRPIQRQARQLAAATRILWYTKPIYAGLADVMEWNAIVYDCSDFWTGNRRSRNPIARWNAQRQARSEARIIEVSDLVLASSTFLAERLQSDFERSAMLVENGVDLDVFRAGIPHSAPELRELPRPRLGFVGTLKDKKIDLGLIADLAQLHPEWSVVLIGPAHTKTFEDADYDRLHGLRNVLLLGARPAAEVPALLQELDVGLLPYRDAEFNHGVFPLKFFEYLAAGLPVVGRGLPSTLSYAEEGVYYHVAGGVEEFAAACELALDQDASRKRRIEIAETADWKVKFATMLDAAQVCARAAAAYA